MMIRILGGALIALALSCSAVICSKNQSIDTLTSAAAITAVELETKTKAIAKLTMSLEQQTAAINDLVSEAERRELLITKHYKDMQLLNASNQKVETELIEVITDESNTDWAYVHLPADVKRVFDHATAKTNSNRHQGSEGVTPCTPAECLPTTTNERGY